MDELRKVEYIILHHTERNVDSPKFVKCRMYFRGWDDVGYHFLIDNGKTTDGKLYVGRDEQYAGAHATGFNQNSVSVCLIGNLDKVPITDRQMETLLQFLEGKMNQYNLSPDRVLGHRELPNVKKTCPGKRVNLEQIRKELLERLLLQYRIEKSIPTA